MHATSIEVSIAYIHGRIENQIEGFANALGVTTEFLASRVSELLRTGRSRLEDQVPKLRKTSKRTGSALGKMEMARNARTSLHAKKKGITPAGRKRLSRLAKKRWRDARNAGVNPISKRTLAA